MLVRPRFSLRFGGAVMNSNNPLQLKQLGVALICIGVAVAALSGISYLRANEAAGWPAVSARVVRSEVEVSRKVGGIRRGQAVQGDYYSAAVRYEYLANGRTYSGSKI